MPKHFKRASQHFGTLVEQIRDDQWSNSTPCSEWDVRQLVRHLVYEDLWAPPLFEGETIEGVGDRFEGDILGSDPKAAWQQAQKGAETAIESDGAMEKIVHLSWGDEKGEEYTSQLLLDHLVHAWDLARGIGADDQMDPDVLEYVYARWKDREEMIRGAGVFGDQQDSPADANTQTKLLALLGRTG
ncbi:MAG TPA: TIGR03086 family metal-binding protein [Actinomycetota bacterium]|nr:TIGR03086 family metal-binding protein [Actinomycetota bacterium]